MDNKQPAVYIMASKENGTLYVGVTTNLTKRVWEHRNSAVSGFTQRYGVKLLVFYELHGSIYDAIVREKQLKRWKREWKIELIEKFNPSWKDLWNDIV
ncbi:MAG: GIY-YIG nuclease family protein [Candidatus Kapaibacterium sp.]